MLKQSTLPNPLDGDLLLRLDRCRTQRGLGELGVPPLGRSPVASLVIGFLRSSGFSCPQDENAPPEGFGSVAVEPRGGAAFHAGRFNSWSARPDYQCHQRR
jgi:hypothetical protein